MNRPYLKPCPFCGMLPSPDNSSVLRPNGIGWYVDEAGRRHYTVARELPQSQWCWTVNCDLSWGGCDCEIHADSFEESVTKWNTRSVIN